MVCYKSSIKKSVVFQDTSNDQSDYNFLKNVHLQNAIGTQLTWNIWKKNEKSYNVLPTNTKDLNKWGDRPCSWFGRLTTVMSVFPQINLQI